MGSTVAQSISVAAHVHALSYKVSGTLRTTNYEGKKKIEIKKEKVKRKIKKIIKRMVHERG